MVQLFQQQDHRCFFAISSRIYMGMSYVARSRRELLTGFSNQEDEKETNIRVAYKEEAVNIGMSFLKRLIPVMEKHVAAFPKCQEWIDQSGKLLFQQNSDLSF
jgi:hypothetical protein